MEQNTLAQIVNEEFLPKMKYVIEAFGKIFAVESGCLLPYAVRLMASRVWQKLDNDYICTKDKLKVFPDFNGKLDKFISIEQFMIICELEIAKLINTKNHPDNNKDK